MSQLVDLIMWVLCLVACFMLVIINFITEPTVGQCPAGWHNNGVRPSGRFECLAAPVGRLDEDGTYGHPETSWQPLGQLRGQVYCTGGSHPIVVSERAVGCQR